MQKKISKPIHYSCDLEVRVGEALSNAGIKFIHESQGLDIPLDFYLPEYKVYIEVKKFHSDRTCKQLQQSDNIVLIQGRQSILFLEFILNSIMNDKPVTVENSRLTE